MQMLYCHSGKAKIKQHFTFTCSITSKGKYLSLRFLPIPLLFIFNLLVIQPAFPNSAAPGFWDVGHGSTLVPLFRNDSAAITQIQMQRERILIDLYPGYAVVKGTYWFYNHSNKPLQIHTGYPINGKNNIEFKEWVTFNDLYHLRVKVNGVETPSSKLSEFTLEELEAQGFSEPPGIQETNNWYVWNMSFAPGTLTQVEVYFIVTTPASITEGYGRKEANGFEYLLQTGAAWKDRILQGEIIVNLQNGLTMEDIHGVFPKSKTNYSGNQLVYRFKDLRPNVNDDLIIWYEGSRDTTGFAQLDPETLFAKVESTDISILSANNLPVMERADFSTTIYSWVFIGYGILIVGTILMGIITLGFIFGIFILIKRLFRK